jgi:hypothetical protein
MYFAKALLIVPAIVAIFGLMGTDAPLWVKFSAFYCAGYVLAEVWLSRLHK